MRRAPLIGALACAAALVPAGPAPAAETRISLKGIGPLKIGMTETAARATGWLSARRPGCELERPRPTSYRLTGAKAPAGVRATVDFSRGRLRSFTFTAGVRTAQDVAPGKTTVSQMVRRYR